LDVLDVLFVVKTKTRSTNGEETFRIRTKSSWTSCKTLFTKTTCRKNPNEENVSTTQKSKSETTTTRTTRTTTTTTTTKNRILKLKSPDDCDYHHFENMNLFKDKLNVDEFSQERERE
jgi:hypothetical protein